MSKKHVRELSVEEMEERDTDHLFEITMDLDRSAQLLEKEAADRVQEARDALLKTLGMLTSHVPEEPSMEHTEYVWKMCKSAMLFRNIVRAEFYRADGCELPDEFKDAREGTVH